jgi:phytoene synthase
MSTNVDPELVEKSRKIHKGSGKTFYLATRMFPKRVRHHTHVLYAFFRKADEIVDTTNPIDSQEEELEKFKKSATGVKESDDPVLQAFNIVRENEGLQDRDIEAFISSMKSDIDKNRYRTFKELREYMDGSASAVGRMMTDIMGSTDREKSVEHATALGEAYQMTNFMRDVEEDIEDYGRIYIPIETLENNGSSVDEIKNCDATEELKNALRHEMERTEKLYTKGVEGIQYLPEDCQFAVLLSSVLYSEHHRKIRKDDFEVFDKNMDVSNFRKIRLLVRCRIEWHRNKNPKEVFDKISCVGSPSSTGRRLEKLHSLASSVTSHL